MNSLLFWMLLPWSSLVILLARRPPLPMRKGSGEDPAFMAGPLPTDTDAEDHTLMPWRLIWLKGMPALMAAPLLFWCTMDMQSMPWTLIGLAPLVPLHILCHRQSRSILEEERRAAREMSWIIWRRGSIQDDIMRAREHEAMDRRMRRCRSTLLLSRDNGHDVHHLFHTLEHRLTAPELDRHQAAALVGGMATHLRHVFMERDRDDIAFGETAGHVARWAWWLEQLGSGPIHISGAPAPGSPQYARKVPSTLFLGMAERMGMALLERETDTAVHWTWSVESGRATLSTSDGPVTLWSDSAAQDWDTAFLLRHGGIAHAGGCWHFELPLIPE